MVTPDLPHGFSKELFSVSAWLAVVSQCQDNAVFAGATPQLLERSHFAKGVGSVFVAVARWTGGGSGSVKVQGSVSLYTGKFFSV